MPGQNLLARIDLFAEPEVVLTDPKYWTADFARLFIESWDDVSYKDPHAGKNLAEVAVNLVARLDKDSQDVLSPRARAILGSSHRALGELAEASLYLEPVLEEYKARLLPRLDEASCYRRVAYLRRDQGRFSEAIEFARSNIRLCQAERANHELGVGYAILGAIYLQMIISTEEVPKDEPIRSLGHALKLIDTRKSTSAYEAAFGNMSLALLEGYPFETQNTFECIRTALRIQAKNRITRRTLPGSQLRWILGLANLRSGATHRAEAILRRASRVLKELGFQGHYSRISIDLAEVYSRQGQWGRLQMLAKEILQIEGIYSKEGLTALRVWYRAIRRREVNPTTWEKVLRTVRWPPQAPEGRLRMGRSSSPRELSRDQPLW